MKLNTKQSLRALIFVPVLAFAASAAVAPMANAVGLDEGVSDATTGTGLEKTDFTGTGGLVQTVTNALLYVIGAISVIMIIVGGIRYVVSNGDSAQITAAKNTILYAVIGLAVALLAFAIVNFVITQL